MAVWRTFWGLPGLLYPRGHGVHVQDALSHQVPDHTTDLQSRQCTLHSGASLPRHSSRVALTLPKVSPKTTTLPSGLQTLGRTHSTRT